MSTVLETGCIRQTRNEVQLEWQIPDFYRSINCNFRSPDFCFSDSWWCLIIFPNDGIEQSDSVEVFLERKDSGPPKTVKLCFGIKMANNTEDRGTATYKVDNGTVNVGPFRLISKLSLLQRRSQMVPSDVLTLTCTLSTVDPHSSEASLSKRLWSLSKNLRTMLEGEVSTDFTLKVDGINFRAHRTILLGRSDYFTGMLGNGFQENDEGEAEIEDIAGDVFQCILTYLYTGEVDRMDDEIAGAIYIAADKLLLAELKNYCVHYMKDNLSQESVCDAVAIAEKYKEPELEKHAMDYFVRHADQIFGSCGWKRFKVENKVLVPDLLEKIIVKRIQLVK